ncbi:MAG: cytochrome b [Gammaproteobacteria bacterium]|nr:cytochrome b [Gammaproteobacteria bacterium]
MLRNTDATYGTVAKLLHWVIALLVIGLIAAGLFIGTLDDDDPLRKRLIGLHAPAGVLVLFLSLARLGWYLVSRPPALPEALASWEKILTRIVAIAFLVLLLAQPLAGIIMFDYFDAPLSFYGLFTFPDLLAKNMDMVEQVGEFHEIFGVTLIVLIALHLAGTIKHRHFDKDKDVDVLKRML